MLQEFADLVSYQLLGLAKESQLGAAVNFFIYDSIKVTLLLAAVVFVVGIVRTFITPLRVKKFLGKKKEGIGNTLAALLGIPVPFCSCSAVPLFIGFINAGVPLGITFSFLIASPLINEIAVTMLFAMFGWQIAAIYIISGLIIAIIAGVIIGRLGLEKELTRTVKNTEVDMGREKKMSWKQRIDFGIRESKRITLSVFPYLIIGIAIGGFIHGFVPSDALAGIAGRDNIFAVPIAVLLGIPLYSNAAGMVPVIGVLTSKGVAMGTALAFMMAVIGLSLPEMIILRKVMKTKLIAVFALILFVAFVITGYLFNAILG
jgi:hypothetical protein